MNTIFHLTAAALIIALCFVIVRLQQTVRMLRDSLEAPHRPRSVVRSVDKYLGSWARGLGIPVELVGAHGSWPLRKIALAPLVQLHLSNEILMIRLVANESVKDQRGGEIQLRTRLPAPQTAKDELAKALGCSVAISS